MNSTAVRNAIIFAGVLCVNAFFYWGFQDNYFFSDDFEWLARAVLAQNPADTLPEILRIEGRDFNPLFMILLTIITRIVGLSPLVFRLLSLLTFSALIFAFFHVLERYFNVDHVIALSAALLLSVNVFVSETVLNLSALVYSLSLLLFLLALKFFLEGKRFLYIVFILMAFLAKETVILAVIPLLFYEKEKKKRLFILASIGGIGLVRFLLQLTAAGTGTYTSFLTTGNFFYKFYFTAMRAMNISPYAMHPAVGILILLLLAVIIVYFVFSRETAGEAGRAFLYFFLFFVVFSLFFALLPKLSSRYFLYPAMGFWGLAALLAHHFFQKNKKLKYEKLKYALVPLLLLSMLFNYPFIRKEVEDYKILGDFSKGFIHRQAVLIKPGIGQKEIFVYKLNHQPLAGVYNKVKNRETLPKLLPFRQHSVGGVIKPGHLVPVIFFPDKIVRWKPGKETPNYFTGRLLEN